jgi:putative transposase
MTGFDPDAHHRRSVRLPDYAYDDGVYFVTICARERECIFGTVVGNAMQLNAWGDIARDEWLQTSILRTNVDVDSFVVMPNHVHAIVVIHGAVGAQRAAPSHNVASGSLAAVVRSYKSAVARRINILRDTPGVPVWQRNYHEHVVRDEKGLNQLREYVQYNPARWAEDRENPAKK